MLESLIPVPLSVSLSLLRLCPGLQDAFVVFITNKSRAVDLYNQKLGINGFCSWDYHVVAVERIFEHQQQRTPKIIRVYDLDSLLPLPVELDVYLVNTFFESESFIDSGNQPLFRVIEAAAFVRRFSSDRLVAHLGIVY